MYRYALVLLVAAFWWAPTKAQENKCVASVSQVTVRHFPDGHEEQWLTYTAKAETQVLYVHEVRSEDQKGREKAMRDANRICLAYVMKRGDRFTTNRSMR
jgi:hypothetical protein